MVRQQENLIRLDHARIPTRSYALEGSARAALNSVAGRIVTDADWARARHSLQQVVVLLRSWEQAQTAQNENREPEPQPKAA
jgi:hypothetical protein